ncbi:MAG: ECF transporter S component [Bacillota bacterium]|nr:ECF transporter S component [Bacillota bacterium]
MLKKKRKKILNARMLTTVGILSAATIILGSTGLGFIPLPMLKLTIMHIPVIIGAIIEGPIAGGLIGLMFGLFSIFQNLTNPNLLSPAFYNPLVSVLPRVLIGIVTYYVYKAVSRFNGRLGIILGAAAGSLTNTIGVLSMIYLLYLKEYAAAKEMNIGAAVKAMLAAGMTNGVLEAVLAAFVTLPVVYSINKINKK